MFSRPQEIVHEFGFIAGQKVADLGAGSGHFSYALSEVLGPDGRVYAVDISPDILANLKNAIEAEDKRNIYILTGDIERRSGTNLRDELVDGVLLSNVMFLLESREEAIREASRILKRGGRMVLHEWREKIPEQEAKELFGRNGLSFQRVLNSGDHHYVMIFKK